MPCGQRDSAALSIALAGTVTGRGARPWARSGVGHVSERLGPGLRVSRHVPVAEKSTGARSALLEFLTGREEGRLSVLFGGQNLSFRSTDTPKYHLYNFSFFYSSPAFIFLSLNLQG